MSMTTGTIVTLEEYLSGSYEPDCEYLDGELVERGMGIVKHAYLQGLLAAYFLQHRKAWGITPLIEVRVRIKERRYRIPDVCVVSGALPQEDILTSPPLIWIEVLSPEDRPLRVQVKVREVLDFGCPWVWVIDPETLESRVYTPQSDYAPEGGVFRIPGTQIAVPLDELEGQ
jgi:Uma2 family endonuclease